MNRKFRLDPGTAIVLVGLGLIAWIAWPNRHAGAATTAAPAQPASALTVSLAHPETRLWPQTVQATGSIAAWQEIIVAPETGGYRIAELMVDVGDHVKRGQLLARLADDSLKADLRKQQATVAQARANLEQATSNLQRAKTIESSGALSAQKLEEYRISEATSRASLDAAQADLDSTRLKLSQTRIVAVDDGIVTAKTGVLGNVVSAGTELYRLIRQGKVEWRPELDSRQLATIRPGQTARVTLPGGQQVTGAVRLVGPALSTSTGRATVYVSLPTDSPARAGMFASGSLALDTKPALTLPQSAIVMRDGRAYVYVLGAGDKVNSHPVTTGRRQGDRVEVLTALPPQASIVASGGAFLSEGAQVSVATADTQEKAQ